MHVAGRAPKVGQSAMGDDHCSLDGGVAFPFRDGAREPGEPFGRSEGRRQWTFVRRRRLPKNRLSEGKAHDPLQKGGSP